MPKDEEKETSEEEVEEDDSEEEGLEEELEDVEKQTIIEGIDNMEFSSFIQPTIEESAPVLERLTGSQGTGFSLSGWESLSPPISPEGTIKEDDPFKYSAGGGENTEVKYVSSEQAVAAPAHVDFRDVGRRPEVRPEVSFAQSSDARIGEPLSIEKYDPTKRMDIEGAGRKDTFEREKLKYEFKPTKS